MFYCFVVKGNKIFPVAMRLRVTPVPIPNTMVKPQAADGTALETVWKSRWLPESFLKNRDGIRTLKTAYMIKYIQRTCFVVKDEA